MSVTVSACVHFPAPTRESMSPCVFVCARLPLGASSGIRGQPGGVGHVITTGLKGCWSEWYGSGMVVVVVGRGNVEGEGHLGLCLAGPGVLVMGPGQRKMWQ